MKTIIRIGVLILMLSFIYSCCTLKDCGYKDFPVIEIGYNKYLNEFDVITCENNTDSVVDSVRRRGDVVSFYHFELIDLREYYFVIKSDGFVHDTLQSINYEIYSFYNDCNTCILSDGGSMAYEYRDLSFVIRGIEYKDTEVVELTVN